MDASVIPAGAALKPRVLIADDSRIVRATIIKQVQGMFDFCEACDGEQAWEMLVDDPGIRILITDLTMPKLDGYGLLGRIRKSEVERIRNLPVVVVSGTDEPEGRERAKRAGATHLIVKSVNTPQLLSQLNVLVNLASSQNDYIEGLRSLMRASPIEEGRSLLPPDVLFERAGAMLDYAIQFKRNFVIFSMCIGIRTSGTKDQVPPPLAGVMKAIGSLLHASVRQSDGVAKVSAAEFAIASGNINVESARRLAERLCGAIVGADIVDDKRVSFIASCGIMSLDECRALHPTELPDVEMLWSAAHARGRLGLKYGLSGVVAKEEEAALRK